MLTMQTALPLARDARGFSLIETLVAMVTGLVVIGALFAILEVSLHQTSRVADVAQATQLGRTTMTRIVHELHSVCLAPGFAPVQAGSNASELRFVNAYSSEAEITSASVAEHRIKWESNALTDYSYPGNGGTSPQFTFQSTPSPLKGTRISEQEGIASSLVGGKPAPIFQYYSYGAKSHSGEESSLSTLSETPLVGAGAEGRLTTAQAETVAAVQIRFTTLPADRNAQRGRGVDLSDQVTFAFSAPASEATVEASPCE
jgi:type II secretory pathway component PulJ